MKSTANSFTVSRARTGNYLLVKVKPGNGAGEEELPTTPISCVGATPYVYVKTTTGEGGTGAAPMNLAVVFGDYEINETASENLIGQTYIAPGGWSLSFKNETSKGIGVVLIEIAHPTLTEPKPLKLYKPADGGVFNILSIETPSGTEANTSAILDVEANTFVCCLLPTAPL